MSRVFISYKSEEREVAERLRDCLLSWGHQPWMDAFDIPFGTMPNSKGWDDAIHSGMKQSQVVIGVMTPASLKSENVLDEWGWALANQRRLFLLWLADVSTEDIPPRYIRIQRIDMRADVEGGLKKLQHALESPALILADEVSARPQPEAPLHSKTEQTNRERMLQKVYDFWVMGVLDNALKESGAFELGLGIAPEAVLKHIDYGDYKLPTSTKIVDVFDDMNRKLLILGAPGAGKTILLLQLARDLISHAQGDANQPIPVVLNLSSWAVERKSLEGWLLDELRTTYQIPKKLAKDWVEREYLLLLLDGLDEVNTEYRIGCVEAINDFRQRYRSVEMVVCSRIADYEMLTRKLDLHGAITLQPLTREQIASYLARQELSNLQATIETDAELQKMAEIPYLLNTMAFAYQAVSAVSLRLPRHDEVGKARRAHLFDDYVEMQLKRANDSKYLPRQSRHYLAWLAGKMVGHGQTIFFVEGLQPNWLIKQLHWAYAGTLGFLGAIFGLIFVLPFHSEGLGPFPDLIHLLSVPLWIFGFASIALHLSRPGSADTDGIQRNIVIVETLSLSLANTISGILSTQPFSGLRYLWLRYLWLRLTLVAGAVLVISGLIIEGGLWYALMGLLLIFMQVTLLFLFSGLITLLEGDGLVAGQKSTRAIPNQGIRLSFRNAIFLGLMVGLPLSLLLSVAGKTLGCVCKLVESS